MKKKNLLCLILCVLIIMLGITSSVFANHNLERDEPQLDIASYMVYINDVLPQYLTLELGENYYNIQTSQDLIINGNPDKNSKSFFVTNDGGYIGWLIVTNVQGVFHSSFGFDDSESIDATIKNRTPIALFVSDIGSLFMKTETEVIPLSPIEEPKNLRQNSMGNISTYYNLEEIALRDVGFSSAEIFSLVEKEEQTQTRSLGALDKSLPHNSHRNIE